MEGFKFKKNTLLKLARSVGIKRISREALIEVDRTIDSISEKIANNAIEFAKHAKRLTVKKEDIELATR
ncbi:MAG: NFYB/HAP3 family transcription factor subunit [Candidatus Aenigmarchaeota archaeon]|nr:NFYB/HAP3 family transcription factor subunit [Candidatus Aenigmarchaeota archaeon]MCX8190648.1 NFYB/HAP3 family transcription factor subunit [Candidatus Aenigmarchaeota archaeon]MDW8159815.1 NFYB/HAP3 family transcription factor subunit [Candidatus Aenigmarchaeota archaeon]